MRRKGQGSASISAVVVFLSALMALGLMAAILPPIAGAISGYKAGLKERGERGSELIRIYIRSTDETESAPPVITIVNGWDRESVLTDYVVVAKDGRVLASGKMRGSPNGIRIPAGAKVDLTPADFGLSYGTFAAMADAVKAIYVRTSEGNSFGSSYGPPPKITADYQIVTVLATTSYVVTANRPSGPSGGAPSTPSSSSSSSGGGGGSSSGGGGGGGGASSSSGGGGRGDVPQICNPTNFNRLYCEKPNSSSSSISSSSSSSGSSSSSSSSSGGGGSGSSSSSSGSSSSGGSTGGRSYGGGGGSRYLPDPI